MGPLARFCPGAIFRAAACVFLGVQLETSSSETLAPLQILSVAFASCSTKVATHV